MAGRGVESCLLCWFRIVRNLGQALSCILARPASCGFSHPPTHQHQKTGICLFVIVEVWRGVEMRSFGSLHRAATLCDRYRASLHVYERSVGFASCKASGRSFYKASVPYPHSASSPPSTKKAGLCLFVITKCSGAGVSNRACSVGFASCETLCKHYHASLRLRSFGSLHLCIDSHLCRCIVQRLCVAVFMHPCITTLFDRYRASMHDPHSASSPPSTKKSRAMPV